MLLACKLRTDIALIEAFSGRLRHECLYENWFLSLEDARENVQSWRRHYNGERSHGSSGGMSSKEFALLAVTAA